MAAKKFPQQGEVWWVNLDPTIGKEISKRMRCLIVSPDVMNSQLRTVIAAPITSTQRDWPTRVLVSLQRKTSSVALDQIRMLDNQRLIKKITKVNVEPALVVLREMFAKP